MGRWSSSVLSDNLPGDSASINILVVLGPCHHYPKMNEMSSDIIRNNNMNEAGTLDEGPLPGSCLVGGQRRSGRHQKIC